MDEIVLKLKEADKKIDELLSGQLNKFSVKTNSEVTVIEMEDINFHFDSAVLLPDYGTEEPQPGTEEQNRITGLGVIFACFKQAEKKEFLQKILVAGHTDKKGTESYNITLSQQRAENVFFMFTGERSKWSESSDAKHQVEDIQQILKWISFNFQYDCDPGPKTNKKNPETDEATIKFQKRYNQDFIDLKKHQSKFSREFIRIKEDGKVGKQTWGAFFDMYILELLIVMGINEDGLNEKRGKLNFVKKKPPHTAPIIGCGENHPASEAKTEDENPVDRRVEILFFDEGEEPELKCHPQKFTCIKSKCDLYPKGFFKRNPVPVDPLPLPSGIAVRVHLKFMYKTPEGTERALPKGFPFTLKFGDDTTEERTIETTNGQIFLQVLRKKKSFTIEFKFSETNYIVVNPSIELSDDELVPESKIKEKIKNKFKVFSLPLQWNLKNSTWELSPAVSNFDDTEKQFKDLENLSVENIGSEASPIKMLLDPKWQFLKFNYFDRFLKTKLSLPPIVLEGFHDSTATSTVNTKSNWLTIDEGSQCLPWILQDVKRPNKNILIRFRSAENTFIESSGTASSPIRKY
ncbi:MAG TPA: OmpA family protein, partial [Ignavibacteriaceae bacterium]|nr:OmpA family protein [Ignavibacteriaceae bacterium]